MVPTRVRLLLAEGHSCYRPRRNGERKRKSVRGCIVGLDLSVLALSIVKQGEAESSLGQNYCFSRGFEDDSRKDDEEKEIVES